MEKDWLWTSATDTWSRSAKPSQIDDFFDTNFVLFQIAIMSWKHVSDLNLLGVLIFEGICHLQRRYWYQCIHNCRARKVHSLEYPYHSQTLQ